MIILIMGPRMSGKTRVGHMLDTSHELGKEGTKYLELDDLLRLKNPTKHLLKLLRDHKCVLLTGQPTCQDLSTIQEVAKVACVHLHVLTSTPHPYQF
jgi:pantothenate kinase-related protein Tda10